MTDLFEQELKALLDSDATAAMSNAASALWHHFNKEGAPQKFNWIGFYRANKEQTSLTLGPFHGKPACLKIAWGKGVCGTSAKTMSVQDIPDVHQFPGHISCDAASNSELVFPLISDGVVLGLLDVDSPVKNGFNEQDKAVFRKAAQILIEAIDPKTFPWA